MTRAIQSFLLVAAVLLTGAAPCFAPAGDTAACPMAHCDRPPAAALEAPACCCAPAGAPPSATTTPAVLEGQAPAPHHIPPAPVLVARPAPLRGATLAAPPEPVPLYLLHATLLI